MIFELLVGHALGDFALQSDVMAKGKNRNIKVIPPPGQTYTPCWGYWLTAHALINGGIVFTIVLFFTKNYAQALSLGLIETAFHWWTDFLKCENKMTPHQDQLRHICSKITYCLMLWRL